MLSKKAQAIGEYVLILGLISTALIAMQVYFKRSIQASIKVACDEIGYRGPDESGRPLSPHAYALLEREYVPPEKDADGKITKPGTVRESNFTTLWDKEENVQRYDEGSQRKNIIKDNTEYSGSSTWEGQTEKPFWDKPKYTGADIPKQPIK